MARIVVEAATDDAACGAGWMEIQVDPTSYAPVLGCLDAAVEAALAGAAAARRSRSASSWRRAGRHPAHALRLADARRGVRRPGCRRLRMSNDERLGRVADFAPACAVARTRG